MGYVPLVVTSFTSTAVYALCFPSLAPYLLELDGGSEACGCNRFLGLAVAIFSAAKVVGAPLAGRAVSAVGASATLISLLILLVASQVLYALSQSIWPVIVSRALMGAASTTSTVCRTIVADSGSSREERNTLTAAVSAASSFGFVCGPMMGGLLFLIPNIGLRAPGWLGCGLAGLNLLLVLALPLQGRAVVRANDGEARADLTRALAPSDEIVADEGRAAGPSREGEQRSSSVDESKEERRASGGAPLESPAAPAADTGDDVPEGPSRVGLAALALVQLALTSPFASFEALVTPFTINAYNYSTVEIGVLFAAASAATLPVNALVPTLLRRTSARALLFASAGFASAACFSMAASGASSLIFITALLAFFAAFAAAQTALFCVFNEVYSSSPSKGVWLGWISSVASAGRCVGPLWAVALYDMGFQSSGGDSGSGDVSSGAAAPSTATAEAAAAPVWLINGGGSLLAAAIVLLAWRAMEPAQPRERS